MNFKLPVILSEAQRSRRIPVPNVQHRRQFFDGIPRLRFAPLGMTTL